MDDLLPGIRVSVRAFIRRKDQVLVQKKRNEDGSHHYCLPGGALDPGETLAEGLKRECAEEIGSKIKIVDLLYAADYFKEKDTKPPNRRQQVELIFNCTVRKNYKAKNGPKPDRRQVGVEWMNISDLCHKCFTPQGLSKVLTQSIPKSPTYIGLID
ncbi:NUDIX domain-containing protein [Magnetovibrio sp. PR-2]|uniref:NUDIX domain-containing protein n=1 Tax=Magnetovibrio sp. PR-2 TaxID=3120356 RepID=UPI002FCE5ABE